jgi:hypothetical protein
MGITSSIEQNTIVNTAGSDVTLEEIFGYISRNIAAWTGKQILWDLRAFDFTSIDSQTIRSFLGPAAPLSETRRGLRTAILVESDVGFGMMRMLQILSEGKIQIELGVFRDRTEAFAWLAQ